MVIFWLAVFLIVFITPSILAFESLLMRGAPGRAPAESDQLRRLREQYEQEFEMQMAKYKEFHKRAIVAEKLNTRLFWLCEKHDIETNCIYIENFWPKDQFVFPLKPGRKAFLGRGQKFDVIQVIGPDSFLAEINTKAFHTAQNERGVNEVRVRNEEYTVLVRGVNTEGLVDNQLFDFPMAFEVQDPEIYKTAFGSTNTVFVLTPLADFDRKADLYPDENL